MWAIRSGVACLPALLLVPRFLIFEANNRTFKQPFGTIEAVSVSSAGGCAFNRCLNFLGIEAESIASRVHHMRTCPTSSQRLILTYLLLHLSAAA